MSIEKVRAYLSERGLGDRIMEFDVSSATVAEAALALGCREQEIAKTMSFMVEGSPVIIVMAGDAKTDNGKFKAFFHTKAVMLKFEEVMPLLGHPVGGVCPFALPEGIPVYLDKSLLRFETVYPAAGTPSSAVRMTPKELEEASGAAGYIDVCKGWQEE